MERFAPDTRARFEDVLRTRRGKLQETPYPILLLAMALQGASGVMTLRRNQLQKEIVFDDGSPVDCRSNIATETLGRFLVASGKLSEQDHQSALSAAAARRMPLEDVLAERKLLPPTEIYRLLQKSLGRKLLEPFSWKSGTFEISLAPPPDESSLRVNVAQLLFTGILKVEAQETADEAVAAAGSRYLSIASDPPFGLDEIRLAAEQQKVVDAVRRGTAVAEIPTATGIDEDEVHRVIYALLLLGIVAASEERAVPFFELENPFAAAEPAPPPPPRIAPPNVVRAEPAAADEVMAAYLAYRRKDAFDLLGVAESDGPPRFIRAYLAMADKFLPSRFDERSPDGLREKAQEVFLAAARAYAELADPERRDALLKRRAIQREPPPPPPAAPALATAPPETAAPPPVIDPEALYRKGRELRDEGKVREALSYFEMAAECDAQNGTYAAEAAWSRYQLNLSPAMTIIKLLKNAIRIDPRSGPAYLYAGRVQITLGNRGEAERLLDQAAMLMPRDLRVVEAMKALRASKPR